jgi:hypothetical protein
MKRLTCSLCLVISVMIASMTISTAIIAFTPTYVVGHRAVLDTVSKLRSSLISDSSARISRFFAVPIEHLRTLELSFHRGLLKPWELSRNISAKLLFELMTSDPDRLLSMVAMWVPTRGIANSIIADTKGVPLVFSYLQSVSGPLLSVAVNETTGNLSDGVLDNISVTGPMLAFAGFFLGATSSSRPALERWAPPSGAYDQIQLSVSFGFRDDAGRKGFIGLNILPSTTSKMLSQLNVGPSARSVLVHTASGFMLGNSWGQPCEVLNRTLVSSGGRVIPQYEEFLAPESKRMKFVRLSDLTDPLVARTVSMFTENFILTVPLPFSTVTGTQGKDDVFVDIFSVRDEFGLDLRVVLLQPLSDHVASVYLMRDVVIAVIAGALGLLILIGGAFGVAISRPLARLGDRMQLTAQLLDDGADEELSVLTEVCLIQASYNTMRSELNRAKSYLPQSVLQQDDDSESETPPSSKSQTPSRSNSVERRNSNSVERRSAASSHRAGGNPNAVHPVARHLNTVTVLRKKMVAVAVFNAMGWHAKVAHMQPGECLRFQETYVSIIAKAVADERGVVDFFQGDHLVATYNAVNALPSCARRSASSALSAVVEMRKFPSMPVVTVGIGIGQAVCGNSGSEKMHRFNVMGPVYSEAFVLEAYGRSKASSSTSPIMLSGLGFVEVDMEFLLQILDIIAMPSGTGTSERRMVAAVHGRKAALNEEWMYELKDADNGNPFRMVNAAFCQVLAAATASSQDLSQAIHVAGSSASASSALLRDELRVKLAQHQQQQLDLQSASSGASGLQMQNAACGGGPLEFSGAQTLARILAAAKTDADLAAYSSQFESVATD